MKLYSRRHKDFKERLPAIADALANLKNAADLDGEIVALDEHGHSRFESLVNRGPQRRTLVYYVLDLLMLAERISVNCLSWNESSDLQGN